VGLYPTMKPRQQAVAGLFGCARRSPVADERLDEGDLAAADRGVPRSDDGGAEAIGVAPAFDMYEICTTAIGGRMITVQLNDRFDLSADESVPL